MNRLSWKRFPLFPGFETNGGLRAGDCGERCGAEALEQRFRRAAGDVRRRGGRHTLRVAGQHADSPLTLRIILRAPA